MTTVGIFIILGLLSMVSGFLFYLKTQPVMPSDSNDPEDDENLFTPETEEPVKSPELNTTFYESFDINGTKILRIDGVYTVFENDEPKVYRTPEQLPAQYRQMLLELQDKKHSSTNDYFLENDNGKYYVRMPGGKKKRYKNYDSIPEDIKRRFAGA